MRQKKRKGNQRRKSVKQNQSQLQWKAGLVTTTMAMMIMMMIQTTCIIWHIMIAMKIQKVTLETTDAFHFLENVICVLLGPVLKVNNVPSISVESKTQNTLNSILCHLCKVLPCIQMANEITKIGSACTLYMLRFRVHSIGCILQWLLKSLAEFMGVAQIYKMGLEDTLSQIYLK